MQFFLQCVRDQEEKRKQHYVNFLSIIASLDACRLQIQEEVSDNYHKMLEDEKFVHTI